MIYIDFNGRCGDQFFQYAFARKIQLYLNNKEPLCFNFYNQERWRIKLNDNSFKNNLADFNVVSNESFINEKTNIDRFGSMKQKKLLVRYEFIKKVCYRLKIKKPALHHQFKMQQNGIYYDDEYFEFYSYPKANCDVFIRGYFENYKNFYNDNTLTAKLYRELMPLLDADDKNKEMLRQIKNSNSICVSLRSWKEIGNDSKTFGSRMICGETYYINAINIMKKLHPDSIFFVFSDDIEWAKETLKKCKGCSFVFENYKNSIGDKIILMSNCKHFIIANSSFSWWVQYLSKNTNKTVISPNRWYNDNDDTRIINPSWFILDAGINN